MIELPETDAVPVVRTSFSSESTWDVIRAALLEPDEGSGYEANLEFVDRPDWSSWETDRMEAQLPRRFPEACEYPFLIVVDEFAMQSDEHAVLLVDLDSDDPSPSFRALPREVAAIEANLSLANLTFSDFAENADPDGVFRGFSNATPDATESSISIDSNGIPTERVRFVEERGLLRAAGLDPEWPGPPPKEVGRRDYARPTMWMVVLVGEGAKPRLARVVGPFATYREAVYFKQVSLNADTYGNVDVVQVETASQDSTLWQ